jgi:pimeloyl-ACP methyl ester carboxylesterase
MQFTGEHVLPDQIATNLPKTACYIQTAYFLIQGQDNVISPTQAAVDYFKCIKVPRKELILIPNAGHFAFMTASAKFLEALTSKLSLSQLPAAHECGETTSVKNHKMS